MIHHPIRRPSRADAPHNLFFAICPPPEIGRRMLTLANSFATGARPMRGDRLHVTLLQLIYMDALPDGLVAAAAAVAETFWSQPFNVLFDHFVAGAGSTLLAPYNPLEDLARFQQELRLALRRAGIALVPEQRFHPHVTLGYDNTRTFATRDDPIIWKVDELVLIDSHVGETRHVVAGRWPLAGK